MADDLREAVFGSHWSSGGEKRFSYRALKRDRLAPSSRVVAPLQRLDFDVVLGLDSLKQWTANRPHELVATHLNIHRHQSRLCRRKAGGGLISDPIG
jgi:hypothetical protein